MIKIGLTEGHGSAFELMRAPAPGVSYRFVGCSKSTPSWVRSPIGGFLREFPDGEVDVIEAVLCPIITKNPWICSLALFQEAMAFNFYGAPTPRFLRRRYLERLFLQPQFKKLVFWSKVGLDSLTSYGGVKDDRILKKARLIYPAVSTVSDEQLTWRDEVRTILFSGDFFRKGGVNVVDAFVRLHKKHPQIKLQLCCHEEKDFRTPNDELRSTYLKIVRTHPGIQLIGWVSHERMMAEILPATDIYAVPTYADTFGFAILEALARSIPVVATNIWAIPEMMVNGESGLLVDVRRFRPEKMYASYIVDQIPSQFREHVTEEVHGHLIRLVEDMQYRKRISRGALAMARERFGTQRRNAELLEVYREALA